MWWDENKIWKVPGTVPGSDHALCVTSDYQQWGLGNLFLWFWKARSTLLGLLWKRNDLMPEELSTVPSTYWALNIMSYEDRDAFVQVAKHTDSRAWVDPGTPGCMPMGKSLSLSGPQFLLLYNGHNENTTLIRQLHRLINIRGIAQWPASVSS